MNKKLLLGLGAFVLLLVVVAVVRGGNRTNCLRSARKKWPVGPLWNASAPAEKFSLKSR